MVTEAGTIEVRRADGVTVIRLLGEHDIATVDRLQTKLEDAVAAGNGVVVSLIEAEFIDGAVIGELYRADRSLRNHDRHLVLHVATSAVIRRVLEITQVTKALPCTGSFDEALRLAATREGDS